MKKRYGKMKYELTGFYKALIYKEDRAYLKLHAITFQDSLWADI